jgi:hypothetical protein
LRRPQDVEADLTQHLQARRPPADRSFRRGSGGLNDLDHVDGAGCGTRRIGWRGEGQDHAESFKVGNQNPREIDTRFFADANGNGDKSSDEPWLLGRSIKWTDPLGASNTKWSTYAPQIMVMNEAHVEAVEAGTHRITIANQTGCTVGDVSVAGTVLPTSGPQTVSVSIGRTKKELTVFMDVACT